MSDTLKITIRQDGGQKTITAARDSTILAAAHGAGIDIAATCGARGRCRSCRCKIIAGTPPPPSVADNVQLGHEAVREGFRLACQTRLVDDALIEPMPPRAESGYQLLGGSGETTAMAIRSGVEKLRIKVQPPKSEHHQTSDIEAVFAALGDRLGTRRLPIALLRDLPAKLRQANGELTVTLFRGGIVDIEVGDRSTHACGIALDIGTTSVVGSLIDLATGEELAAFGAINPQATFGADLMSRIAHAQFNEKNLAQLRGKLLSGINDMIGKACEKAGVSEQNIYKVVAVGNTCMHHILLGIDVSYLGLAPYAPVVRDAETIHASEFPLKSVPHAHICTLPILAGFVGADAIACVLATRLYESEDIRGLVDIGTNGEMVLGSRDRLIACSAPAGPAFEGAQIRHGMRGAAGAIERVEIDTDITCGVIGAEAAIGICGSGLIEACARASDAGILAASGSIVASDDMPPAIRARIRTGEQGRELVLVWAGDSGKNEDITLTQGDIRQLQLAKSAIYSGVAMLMAEAGVTSDTLNELLLCGGFGNYIDVASAVRIRLLPDLPVDRITYAGNAALMGAQMALLADEEIGRAEELIGKIEHIALAARPDFQDLFIDGMKFGTPGPVTARSKEALAS